MHKYAAVLRTSYACLMQTYPETGYCPCAPTVKVYKETLCPQKEHSRIDHVNRLTNISKGVIILTLLIFSVKSEEGQKAITVASSKSCACQTNQHTESQNLVTRGSK